MHTTHTDTHTHSQVHAYDSSGNAVSKLPLYCNEGFAGAHSVVGLEWYDGVMGYAEPNCPVLAVCLDNGRMQVCVCVCI